MKISSTGCFALSITWILVSLLWFFWVGNAMVGVIWLAVGLIELLIAFKLRKKEQSDA